MEQHNQGKIRQIEQTVKAPDSIRIGVQSTLNTYRLIGDIAGLYIDGMAQTLIGFTELVGPTSNQVLLQNPDNDKKGDA